MSPEGLAGFAWIFAMWQDIVLSMLAATEPLIGAISSASSGLVALVASAWLFLILIRIADGGLIRGLIGGAVIFWVLLIGMRPATVTLPSGSSVQMLQIQAIPLHILMIVHREYRDKLDAAVSDHRGVAGTIIPAEAAVDNAVARAANLFGDTDLARLIRDYNASCAPGREALAGPGHEARVDALHAVGLLGGGLGIPDEELGVLAQARAVGSGLATFVMDGAEQNGGWLNYLLFGGAARQGINRAQDLAAAQSRRAAGIEALANAGPFMGTQYVLPSQAHWQAIFDGKRDATASYLPIRTVPGVRSQFVETGGREEVAFTPADCLQAYQIAQAGAEAAYRALRESGAVIAGGQRVSAEVGAVATANAWQRFMSQSLQQTTGMQSGSAEAAAGMLAAVQMFKDVASWLDLQTLLPGYVMLSAWMFWLTLLLAPLALLLAPLRGAQVLIGWASLLLFSVITMIAAHLVIVGMSFVMASAAVIQAGSASGWMGAGADFDAMRGFLGAMSAILLALVTWIASSFTGVSVAGLAGSLTGAMATATGVGGFVTKAAGTVMAVSRLGAAGGAAGKAAGRGGRPGGGGPSSVIQPRPASPSPVPSSAASSMSAPQRSSPGPSSVSRANWPSSKPNAGSQDGGRKSPLIPPRQDS
jgi:hypothetical protein